MPERTRTNRSVILEIPDFETTNRLNSKGYDIPLASDNSVLQLAFSPIEQIYISNRMYLIYVGPYDNM